MPNDHRLQKWLSCGRLRGRAVQWVGAAGLDRLVFKIGFEVIGERLGAQVAVAGLFGQGLQDDGLELHWDEPVEAPGRDRLLEGDLVLQLC